MVVITASSDDWYKETEATHDSGKSSSCQGEIVHGLEKCKHGTVEPSSKKPIRENHGPRAVLHRRKFWNMPGMEERGGGNRCSSRRSIVSILPPARDSLTIYENGFFLLLALSSIFMQVRGFGAMSSIAISSGDDGLVCAIEASGKQQAVCWGGNSSDPGALSMATGPPLIGLTGGRAFMCGLIAGTSEPFCWRENQTGTNVVLDEYLNYTYSSIAAGANHVCAVRTSMNVASGGIVDCWPMVPEGISNYIIEPLTGLPPLRMVVAGNNYSCGLSNQTGLVFCWGISAFNATEPPSREFDGIASGGEHMCGILRGSREAKCWGDNRMGQAEPPSKIRFVALTGGYDHTCGIREDSHEVVCWGNFNLSAVPQATQFLAIASTHVTCGVREDNLLVDCWGAGGEYRPPVQLFSPGLCRSSPCSSGEFYFNASSYGVPNLLSLCVNSSQQICAPCAHICPSGFFLSSPCVQNSDRQCTPCSLCQNETCQTVCSDSPQSVKGLDPGQPLDVSRPSLGVILGASLSGGLVVASLCIIVFYSLFRRKRKHSIWSGRSDVEVILPNGSTGASSISAAMSRHSHDMIRMQAFRLAELREATNNFKELNELGRGSYGFVYKAVLPDGRQAAVKRANAARRIHSNSRDFEAELEILCKVRHAHLVNLLGYCEEMGERLLVYEFMPHGTLHDHLHGGLSPLSWGLRLKIAMQAARGVQYLHEDASPRIVHRDIKSSNILLDGEWGARVADFGLASGDRCSLQSTLNQGEAGYIDPNYYKSQNFTEKSDVYSFGVVLLELLSGRKAMDTDFNPPNLVEWAAPLIGKGKGAAILDRNIDLPKNVEPLLRLADVAELCVRSDPEERPSMSEVAMWLEHLIRGSSSL